MFLNQPYKSSSWISFVYSSNWALCYFYLLCVSYCVLAHGSLCCEELHALSSGITKIHVLREADSSQMTKPNSFSDFCLCILFWTASELISLKEFIAVVKCCPQHLLELLLLQVFPTSDFFLQNILAVQFFKFSLLSSGFFKNKP